MPKSSDINAVIDDPTKELTQADLDPIGSADKKPSWAGQGEGAKSRTGQTFNQTYLVERSDRIKQHALELSIDSLKGQDAGDEHILARASAFEKHLLGETDGAAE